MTDINKYYQILGLKPGASTEEIKQSYRKLAKIWHPDRFYDDPQLKEKAEEEIKRINAAYQKLKSYEPNSANETLQSGVYASGSSGAEGFYNQGVENAEAEKYEQALDDFSRAIKINPEYIEAYKYRGLVCAKMGYDYRSKSDLQKAAELERKHKKTQAKPQSTSTASGAYAYPPRSQPSQPPQAKPSSTVSKSTLPWRCVQTLIGHSDIVAAVAINPKDGRIVISGSFDKTIKVWNLATGKFIYTLTGHTDKVRCLAMSRDGVTIASGSADKTIKLWYIPTGKLIRTLGGLFSGHSNQVCTVAFSPDRKTLASGSADKTIKLWEISTGKEINTITSNAAQVLSLAIHPNGKIIASGGMEKPLRIRQIDDGKLIRSIPGNSDYIYSLAFNKDGQILASGSSTEIKLWQMNTGEEIYTLKGHSDAVYSVAFSPDGKTLASGSVDGTIALWEVTTGKKICTLSGHAGVVYSVAFSPDGKTIASGSHDRTIKIWKLVDS